MVRPQDKLVLVVDDEPDLVLFLSTALEDAGFRVRTASDGDEALDILQQEVPDFISLDLVMPRKSGIRFFRELRRHREWARIPVMVVTSHARDDQGVGSLQEILGDRTMSGPGAYLEKPVKVDDFVRAVADRLGVTLEDASVDLPPRERLRQEVISLLADADGDDLARALNVLREGPAGKR